MGGRENKTKSKVAELLREAIVIDGHSDVLVPITEGKMNIADRVSIPDMNEWQAPPGYDNHPFVKYG